MAKRATASKAKSELLTIIQDSPLKGSDLQNGLLSDWLLSFLKDFKPDLSKLDLVQHRRDLTSMATNYAGTTKLPGNIDDTGWLFLADAVSDMLENAIRTDPTDDDGGVVLFGAATPNAIGAEEQEYDKASVGVYLEALGTSIPEANRKKLEKNPHVIASLKRLSRENQIRVLNSSTLLDLLIRWGPLVLKIIMLFLGGV